MSTVAPVCAQSRAEIAEPGRAGSVDTPPSLDETQESTRSDLTAARLLETARRDRAQGEPEIAQRVLELLIARYPNSPSCDAARRELFEIYAANAALNKGRAGSAQAIAPASPSISASPATASLPQVAPPATDGAGSSWQTSVVSFRRLQDDLRNGVGDRVFFAAGSADLGSRAQAVIASQAEWLMSRPDVEALIEGHADDSLAGADNERIATDRAVDVRDRLIAEGVEPERVQISPRGARDPVAICNDTDCAAQNRRAVLQVAVRRPQVPRNSAVPDASGLSEGTLRR